MTLRLDVEIFLRDRKNINMPGTRPFNPTIFFSHFFNLTLFYLLFLYFMLYDFVLFFQPNLKNIQYPLTFSLQQCGIRETTFWGVYLYLRIDILIVNYRANCSRFAAGEEMMGHRPL